MKTALATIALYALYLLIGSTGLYAAARIILPEMNLPVPPFGAVFWATFWISLASITIIAIRETIGD